jgi:hypothetical protein
MAVVADPLYWRTIGGGAKRATVVYVHGFFDTTTSAIEKHRLWEQFAASGLDATFIVAPAPKGEGDHVISTPDLAALLAAVNAQEKLGTGPVIVMGHSAAHGTIKSWLARGQGNLIHQIILLDANYGSYSPFVKFPGRMTIFGFHTKSKAVDLARARNAVLLDRIPPDWTSQQRAAQTLYAESQFDHFAMVQPGGAIPLALKRINFPARVPRFGWRGPLALLAGAALAGAVWYAWRRRQRRRLGASLQVRLRPFL